MARASHPRDNLLAVDEALAGEIARLEAAHPRLAPVPSAPPPGMKLVGAGREHVHDDPAIIRVAFARWLFWRHVLARATPTPDGLRAAYRRYGGALLHLLALRDEMLHRPLPLTHAHTRVPRFALAPRAPLAPKAPAKPGAARLQPADTTRAGGDGEMGGGLGDDAAAGDAAAWWEVEGDLELLAKLPRAEFEQLSAEFGPPYIPGLGIPLDYDEVLRLSGAFGFSALEIATLLDAAWAESSMLAGGAPLFESLVAEMGADMGGAMGLAGAFDVADPYVLDYLRLQSGYLIRGIDETTRGFVAETLWSFLGGADAYFAPQNVAGVGRLLQSFADGLGNDLAGMSRRRAYLIAVTETARAESIGTFVALWRTGVRYKQWMVTAGACLICLGNAEAGAVPLTEAFPSRHQAPPGHPVCRCSLAAVVPDVFRPDDWTPRDPGDLDAALFDPAYGAWPNTDLSALGDMELGDIDTSELGGRMQVAEQSRAGRRALPQLSLPVARIRRLAALGDLLAEAADAAAARWARAAGARVPAHLDQWKALTKRVAANPGEFAAADAAYGDALSAGVRHALDRWHAVEEG